MKKRYLIVLVSIMAVIFSKPCVTFASEVETDIIAENVDSITNNSSDDLLKEDYSDGEIDTSAAREKVDLL